MNQTFFVNNTVSDQLVKIFMLNPNDPDETGQDKIKVHLFNTYLILF